MTRPKETMRTTPSHPCGRGSAKIVSPATIGSAFVNRVAIPAVVSGFPRWKPAWSTIVPSA
jgi:hypothetical protein